jgi:hypothetical protein
MRFTFAAAAILATTYATWEEDDSAKYEQSAICNPNDLEECIDVQDCDEDGCNACFGAKDDMECEWVEGAKTYGDDCYDDTGCWYCEPDKDDEGEHYHCYMHTCSDGACYGCEGKYVDEDNYDYECELTAFYEGCDFDNGDKDCWWCDHTGECEGYGKGDDEYGNYTCYGALDWEEKSEWYYSCTNDANGNDTAWGEAYYGEDYGYQFDCEYYDDSDYKCDGSYYNYDCEE